MNPMEPRTATLLGHPGDLRPGSADPVLLLVHGWGGGYENWREVTEPVMRHYPGHEPAAFDAAEWRARFQTTDELQRARGVPRTTG